MSGRGCGEMLMQGIYWRVVPSETGGVANRHCGGPGPEVKQAPTAPSADRHRGDG